MVFVEGIPDIYVFKKMGSNNKRINIRKIIRKNI